MSLRNPEWKKAAGLHAGNQIQQPQFEFAGHLKPPQPGMHFASLASVESSL